MSANKLWLWKNFVDGKPEYWAFDNPFPINLTNGDPQTLGEPCGYAVFKPSRQGRTDVSEAKVIERIKQSLSKAKGEADAHAVTRCGEPQPVAWLYRLNGIQFVALQNPAQFKLASPPECIEPLYRASGVQASDAADARRWRALLRHSFMQPAGKTTAFAPPAATQTDHDRLMNEWADRDLGANTAGVEDMQ